MGNHQMKLYEIIFKITFALVGISLYFTCHYVGKFCDFVLTQIFLRFANTVQLTDENGKFSIQSAKKSMKWWTILITPIVVVLGAIYPVCLVVLMAARLMLIEIPLKYLPSIIQWFLRSHFLCVTNRNSPLSFISTWNVKNKMKIYMKPWKFSPSSTFESRSRSFAVFMCSRANLNSTENSFSRKWNLIASSN